MRRLEECPFRYEVQGTGKDERARCALLERLADNGESPYSRVPRATCGACSCEREPSPRELNPVVASLLFLMTKDAAQSDDLSAEAREHAVAMKLWALGNLDGADAVGLDPARGVNEGDCIHRGAQISSATRASNRGTVRVPVFACHHLLHDRTTLRECQSCRDFTPKLTRGGVRNWAVGVTTAPREVPTLARCLESLRLAGWETPRLFVEPGAEIPAEFAHLPVTPRSEALGEWPNWFLSLGELYLRDPEADAYLMVQDDTVFCSGVRAFLEAELWPGDRVGLVSVYCPAPYAREEAGWVKVAAGGGVVGALTFVFPNAAVRALLAHPGIVDHRKTGARLGLDDTDGVVGRWAHAARFPVYYHSPSLAQHIGETSTVWPGAPNDGVRTAGNFVGESFDAQTFLRSGPKPLPDVGHPDPLPLEIVRPPLVSCIVPTRDRRAFVALALRHFERQDYPARELVIVDDGDDPVGDLVHGLPNVRYVRLTGKSTIGEKRNLACVEARGEIIVHWDDDDWHAPARLSYQVAPIVADEADVTGLANSSVLSLPDTFWSTDETLHRRMFVGDVHGGTIAFHRSLWDEGARYPDQDLAEDAAFLSHALNRQKRLRKLDNRGHFVYVRHGRNAWTFEPGVSVDAGGWQRVEPPRGFPLELLPQLQHAAGLTPSAVVAVPSEPISDTVPVPETLTDCLGRCTIARPIVPLRARQCIATVVSPGYTGLLDDMLGSLGARGGCPDALRVVFAIDADAECVRVAAKHGATLVPCTRTSVLNPTVKSALYSAALVVDAEQFLCLDADMIILGRLDPIFAALDALPAGSLLACREANEPRHADLFDSVRRMYWSTPDDLARFGIELDELGRYSLIVNDGLFAGSRSALLRLDATIRRWTGAAGWVDERPDIGFRNQFFFNLALARLDCGVELDPIFNLQMYYQDVEKVEDPTGPRAVWRGNIVRVLHFCGGGRSKLDAWGGRFSRVPDPLVSAGGGDAYADFLHALRAWVGERGTSVLARSFYGTTDAQNGRVADRSIWPLLALLHHLIRASGCIRVLETGTAHGVLTACLASAVAHRDGGKVVTLDNTAYANRDVLWAFLPKPLRARIEPRLADSLRGMEAALTAGETYEAALLNTTHTEEHVWAEFQLATRLVCPGGLILIHDPSHVHANVGAALDRIERAGYGVVRLGGASLGVREDDGLGLAVIENRRQASG